MAHIQIGSVAHEIVFKLSVMLRILGQTRRMTSLVCFSEEQDLLRKSVRDFARREIGPLVTEMDKQAQMNTELIKQLFTAGYMGIEVEVKYNGSQMSFGDSMIIIEEISRVDPAVAVLVDIHNTLITRSVALFGTEEQKAKYLPRLTTSSIGSFCLSEANAGSDAFALRTNATCGSNGKFRISGEKLWISNSREAEIFVVFARVDKSAEMGAFLVDRTTQPAECLSIRAPEKKLGIRASSTCAVHFLDAEAERLGSIDGRKISMALLNEGRIGIAAQMLGLAKSAYSQSLDHIMTRQQFGQRLFDHQAVRFGISQTHMEILIAEQLIWRAVELKEMNKDIKAAAAIAKLFTTELATRVASQSIDLMGGMGYCSGEGIAEGSSVEKLFRDAKIGTIYEGTSNMQLETIAKSIEKTYQA